jgi:hypothetical protein
MYDNHSCYIYDVSGEKTADLGGTINCWQDSRYFDWIQIFSDENDSESCLIYNVQWFFLKRMPFSSSLNKPIHFNSSRWSFNDT